MGPPKTGPRGRRLRTPELGFSGVVGQLRGLDNIRPTDPLTLVADRSSVQVWGAAFADVIWAVNPRLQLGLEGNYRSSNYDSFADKDAWLVISEVLIRLGARLALSADLLLVDVGWGGVVTPRTDSVPARRDCL